MVHRAWGAGVREHSGQRAQGMEAPAPTESDGSKRFLWTLRPPTNPINGGAQKSHGQWAHRVLYLSPGWTRYLALDPAEFVHREPCGCIDSASLRHVAERTGVRLLLHVAKPEDAETDFMHILPSIRD